MTRKSILWQVILFVLVAAAGLAQSADRSRDAIEQPERVMEATGVKPGMVIGEIGAGQGYFTFWLAKGVGESGKVYANDINASELAEIERQRTDESHANIETILGTVDAPLFPAGSLDMV